MEERYFMDEQRVQQLVKEYRAGEITRRQFINRATVILGGAALANALLIAANGGSIPQVAAAMGQTMAPTGAATMAGTAAAMDIETSTVEFKVDDVTAPGYMARPKGAGPFPGVVVIQEWWGVDDHIKNVTERFARAGFVALAPDLYHGQVAKEPSDAQKLVATVMLDQAVKEIQGAVNHLVWWPTLVHDVVDGQ
jgi:carboxymethylenebutenolidase